MTEGSTLLSIIVCTRNRAVSLARALESLVTQDPPGGAWEIVVVDNGSTDATADVIRSFAGRGPVRYAFESLPGLGRARNCGIAHSKGALLAFTDDDVIAHKDWAAQIVSTFATKADAAAAYGYTYGDADVSTMYSLRTRPHSCYLEGKEAVYESSPGNNMAFRREVIDRIGGFDPSLGPGAQFPMADDSDFQYRFLKAGFRAHYDPQIKVWHGPDVSARPFEIEVLRCDAGLAAWYGKHSAHGDLFAVRQFLTHVLRNCLGIRSLISAIRRGDGQQLRLRTRRLGVLLQAFCSRAIMELRQ